jgi:hypothetical protein
MLQDITGVLFLYEEYRGYLAGQRQAWELFQANRPSGGSAGSGPSGKLPLLPRLKGNGKDHLSRDDAEWFCIHFELYCSCVKGELPMPPLLLAQDCLSDFPDARLWFTDLAANKDNVTLTVSEVTDKVRQRFIPSLLTRSEEAHQQLLDGTVRMDPKKGLAESISRFREYVSKAGTLSASTAIYLFRKGLTSALIDWCQLVCCPAGQAFERGTIDKEDDGSVLQAAEEPWIDTACGDLSE